MTTKFIHATDGGAGVRRFELRNEKNRRQVMATFSGVRPCCLVGNGSLRDLDGLVASAKGGTLSRSGRRMGVMAAGRGQYLIGVGGERANVGIGGTGGGGDAIVGLGGGERYGMALERVLRWLVLGKVERDGEGRERGVAGGDVRREVYERLAEGRSLHERTVRIDFLGFGTMRPGGMDGAESVWLERVRWRARTWGEGSGV